MIKIAVRAILLDIEGTTSSVSFVYDVLFPYVRRELPAFLRDHWTHAPMKKACEQIARDAGAASFVEWSGNAGNEDAQRETLLKHLYTLMDADSKATGLKDLQGLISKIGYANGSLRSHVYADVPPALQRWSAAGKTIAIFSSGSIAAQKSFFGHTEAGNLLSFFRAHFDTTTGAKREAASYTAIARALEADPKDVLFISDVTEELNAAQAAGMATALAVRPGNKTATAGPHPAIHSFDEVELDS